MFADPSKVDEAVTSPVRAIWRVFARRVAVEALPITDAVIVPAWKLPSASLCTRVLGVFVIDSKGRSYYNEFHAVTPSPILIRPVSISIPNSPMANVGLTFDHSCADPLLNCILFAIGNYPKIR